MDLQERYARKCDITGKGMNEGWVWCDGAFYTADLKDTLNECVKDKSDILNRLLESNFEAYNEPHDEDEINEWIVICEKVESKQDLTPEELLMIAYRTDYCFWTTWYDESFIEDYYYTAKGKLIELN